MPRWLLIGLMIVAGLAAFRYFSPPRQTVPEVCQEAVAALESGDFDRAVDSYLLCLESEELPEEVVAQVFSGLGLAYAGKGNHYQAIKDYSEAIRINPNLAWAYNNRCWSYALIRRPDEALEDCNKAVAMLPDEPAILDSRALAYWLRDEKDKARADLERAKQINSSVPGWQERFQAFESMF